jgi:hypothetical protein
MLVGADDGAIDAMHVPIELAGGVDLLLQCVKHVLEDAGLLPAVEAAGHGTPGAIALRQVVPWGACAKNPHHAIEAAAVVDGRPSRPWFLRRKQRSEPLPLCIGQVSSVHSTQ